MAAVNHNNNAADIKHPFGFLLELVDRFKVKMHVDFEKLKFSRALSSNVVVGLDELDTNLANFKLTQLNESCCYVTEIVFDQFSCTYASALKQRSKFNAAIYVLQNIHLAGQTSLPFYSCVREYCLQLPSDIIVKDRYINPVNDLQRIALEADGYRPHYDIEIFPEASFHERYQCTLTLQDYTAKAHGISHKISKRDAASQTIFYLKSLAEKMVSKSYSTKENDNMKMEIYARKMINTNSTDNTQQHLCSASFLTATFKKNKCPIIEKLLNDNPMNMDPTEQDFANLVKLIKACSLNMEIVNDVTTESVEQSASVVKHCVAISISTEPVITSQAMENSLSDALNVAANLILRNISACIKKTED